MERTNQELEARDKCSVDQEGTRPGPVFRPDVDILERADAYVLRADLPGAAESDVRVRFEDGVLSLDADLSDGAAPSWTPRHLEYRSGGWHREFRLSDGIDIDRAEASMKDGVLTLELPKQAATQPRLIDVRAG